MNKWYSLVFLFCPTTNLFHKFATPYGNLYTSMKATWIKFEGDIFSLFLFSFQKVFSPKSVLYLVMCACSVVSDSFATPWTVAHQVPLSMGFSKQEYWSGLPFPPPGDLPDPGMELESLGKRILYLRHLGGPCLCYKCAPCTHSMCS